MMARISHKTSISFIKATHVPYIILLIVAALLLVLVSPRVAHATQDLNASEDSASDELVEPLIMEASTSTTDDNPPETTTSADTASKDRDYSKDDSVTESPTADDSSNTTSNDEQTLVTTPETTCNTDTLADESASDMTDIAHDTDTTVATDTSTDNTSNVAEPAYNTAEETLEASDDDTCTTTATDDTIDTTVDSTTNIDPASETSPSTILSDQCPTAVLDCVTSSSELSDEFSNIQTGDGAATYESTPIVVTNTSTHASATPDVATTAARTTTTSVTTSTATSATASATSVISTQTTTLSDGIYVLTNVKAGKAIQIANSSTKSSARVKTYTSNDTATQRWQLIATDDGYYTIQNVNSGLYLSVPGNKAKSRKALKQYAYSGKKGQLWSITNIDGTYLISSCLNTKFVIAVKAGSTANNATIQLYKLTGSTAQCFVLEQITQTIQNGIYQLTNANSGKVLGVKNSSLTNKGNVKQYSDDDSLSQSFYIHYNTNNGYYTLTSVLSGKVLDVKNAIDAEGTNVRQYTYKGTAGQLWAIRAYTNSNGTLTYGIFSALGGRALGVKNASIKNSANVAIYTSNDTSSQRWKASQITDWLPQGSYRIVTSNKTSNALGISGNGVVNKVAVTTSRATSSTFLTWELVWDGAYAKIVDVATGKVLSIRGSSKKSGARIWQFTSKNTSAQRWKPIMTVTGIKLRSKLSSKLVLTVKDGSTSAGTPLQSCTSNNKIYQRFCFVSTSLLVENATYTIRLDADSDTSGKDYVLTVKGGSTSVGALLRASSYTGALSQQFKLIALGNGSYRLKNVKSGMYVTSTSASKSITQTAVADATTAWLISWDASCDSIAIVSVQSGYALTASRPSIKAAVRSTGNTNQGLLFVSMSTGVSQLNGIDISGWNPSIVISNIPGDFVIVKATQGTTYTNPYFISQANATLASGKLLGLYHFVDTSKGAVEEATYFVNTIKSYIGKAVLFLDWENNDSTGQNNISAGVSYAKTFLDKVYELTGVKPLIYMSKSVTGAEYDWSSVSNAGYELWMAQYLNKYYTDGQNGYVTNPTLYYNDSEDGQTEWSYPLLYQYTSRGKLSGYDEELDLDAFYGDESDWNVLASVR